MEKQIPRRMKKVDSTSAPSTEAPLLHQPLSLTSPTPTQLHDAEMVKGVSSGSELYSSPVVASSTEPEPSVQDEDLEDQTGVNEVSSLLNLTTDPHDDGNEVSPLLNLTNDLVNEDSSDSGPETERVTTEPPTAEKRIEEIAKGLISRTIKVRETSFTESESILAAIRKLMDTTEDKEKQCSRNDWGKDCKFTKDGDKNWCRMHQICSQYSKLKSKGVAPQESGEQTSSELPSEQCARITGSLSVLARDHNRLTKTVKDIETLQTNLKSVEVPIDANTKVEDLQRMAEVYGALQKGCAKMATIQLQIKEGWNRVGAERGAAGTEIPASESAGN